MHIFKYIFVFVIATWLSAQNTQIIVNNEDTLIVNANENVQSKFDSLLNKSNNWGDYFELNSIHSDSVLKYKKLSIAIKIDTLIFPNGDLLRPSIRQQMFKSLIGSTPIVESIPIFTNIINSVPYLTSKSNITFGLHKENSVGAIIKMVPDFSNYFSGILGASRSDNKWTINGQIDIHLENQWRTAGIVDLHWKRLDEESQQLTLRYEEPHPFGLPIGGSIIYEQDLRGGKYVNSNSSAGIIKTIPGIGKWGFGGKTTAITPTAKGDSLGLIEVQSQTIYISGIMDHRNDRWLPNDGLFWSIYTDIGKREVIDTTSVMASISGIVERYFPMGQRYSIMSKIWGSGKWLNTGEVHTGEKIRYGGANRLRGYLEDFYQSNWVIIPSLEISAIFDKKQRIFLFLDSAIQNQYKPTPFGYGLGFTQVTKNSALKITYGLGRGDSLGKGKIHIQFLTRL